VLGGGIFVPMLSGDADSAPTYVIAQSLPR
jgi:hypothetical protein